MVPYKERGENVLLLHRQICLKPFHVLNIIAVHTTRIINTPRFDFDKCKVLICDTGTVSVRKKA